MYIYKDNYIYGRVLTLMVVTILVFVSCDSSQISNSIDKDLIASEALNQLSADSLDKLQFYLDNLKDRESSTDWNALKGESNTNTEVFASGQTSVTTWDALPTGGVLQEYGDPAQFLGAAWQNPHEAFVISQTHPWENGDGAFPAEWINAWADWNSGNSGVGSVNWTKYTTTISGEGDYFVRFMADNWAWVYLDGEQIGDKSVNDVGDYPVSLSGDHEFTFVIYDQGGLAGGKFRLETKESYVDNGGELEDTTPPELTYNVEATELWPPNHKMRLVVSDITASDVVDSDPSVTITVTSNEPQNGRGDGNTDSDWNVVDNGDGSFDVEVRAERNGKGEGRTYSITIAAADASGNEALETVTVTVPHSMKGGRR